MKKVLTLLIGMMFLTLLASCGSYYKVTEPASEKVYYTQKIDKAKSGAISFKDAVTENEVTIQNSEVTEISKDEFKVNTLKDKK